MGVNGVIGDAGDMAKEALTNKRIEFLMRRPMKFSIVVNKPDGVGRLGLVFEYVPTGKSLLITDIEQGLIQEWNSAYPDRQVKPNDYIVEVNGFSGKPEGLLRLCK